ncbi:MAG: hypothetical protein HY738_15110 [Bacteroidia bacterium]|nr:hypothetical protein [Bacteroidia bacterium]
MKSILTLLIIINVISVSIYAQSQNQQQVDSLFNILKTTKHDTVKVKLYLEIGETFENNFPDTTFYYYNKALAIANKTNKKIK